MNRIGDYVHAPALKPITLTNDKGDTLFRGVRHGIIRTDGINGRLLERLSDDELRRLLGEWYYPAVATEPSARAQGIEFQISQVRESLVGAISLAHRFRGAARRTMAREAAAAALAGDPEKCQRAVGGEIVDLNLCAITLFRSDQCVPFGEQDIGFRSLNRLSPTVLYLSRPADTPCAVQARIKVRRFCLSENGGPMPAAALRAPGLDLRRLLGSMLEWRLGGDAKTKVNGMNARARRVHGDCGPLNDDRKRLERNARALTEAGQQLKALWLQRKEWPAGLGAHMKLASRLALVAYLMGETPLLSGSDADLTGQLDAETKLLATVAHNSDGHVPPLDLDVDV